MCMCACPCGPFLWMLSPRSSTFQDGHTSATENQVLRNCKPPSVPYSTHNVGPRIDFLRHRLAPSPNGPPLSRVEEGPPPPSEVVPDAPPTSCPCHERSVFYDRRTKKRSEARSGGTEKRPSPKPTLDLLRWCQPDSLSS